MKKYFIIALILLLAGSAFADKWKVYDVFKNVTPVDVSYGDKHYIVVFESGRFLRIADDYLDDSFDNVALGTSVGSFEWSEDKKGNFTRTKDSFRWVTNKALTAKKKSSTPKTVSKSIPPRTVSTSKKTVKKAVAPSWNKVGRDTPPQNTAVLVKYKNGLITVAYLDIKNEWRLNTDRDSMFGGDVIKTIVEWRLI